jgi:hypothetical protein
MKTDNNKIIILILTTLFVLYLYKIYYTETFENDTDCPNENNISTMPEKASEACQQISSKADEILAQAERDSVILQNLPVYSLFNPNNYSSENTTESMIRNIVTSNLSSCELTEISNSCIISSDTSQTNEIDTSMCTACNIPGVCVVSGNTQINTSVAKNNCTIQLAIKKLLDKKNSVDAQALAKVLQKADGILSGNTTKDEKCSMINTDLSSSAYLSAKSECLNNISLLQRNTLKGCGSFINNIQKNNSDAIQSCMINAEYVDNTAIDSTGNTKISSDLQQKSEGITSTAMIIGSIASIIIAIVILVIFIYLNT